MLGIQTTLNQLHSFIPQCRVFRPPWTNSIPLCLNAGYSDHPEPTPFLYASVLGIQHLSLRSSGAAADVGLWNLILRQNWTTSVQKICRHCVSNWAPSSIETSKKMNMCIEFHAFISQYNSLRIQLLYNLLFCFLFRKKQIFIIIYFFISSNVSI